MKKYLKKLYINEQFNPRFFGLFINPFYFARKGLYLNFSTLITRLRGRMLDIGCGTKPYESLCQVEEYIGLEIDGVKNRKKEHADFYYDGNVMPFENSSFDSVLINQVLEHVFNPNVFLKEVNRVVKKDGLLLVTVPFVWDEHEQPFDYARYSSFGLKHILSQHGFEILEHRKSNNGIEVIFQLLSAYIYKITLTSNKYFNILSTVILISPINIIGLILSKLLPKNDDLYLDNIVLARKFDDL